MVLTAYLERGGDPRHEDHQDEAAAALARTITFVEAGPVSASALAALPPAAFVGAVLGAAIAAVASLPGVAFAVLAARHAVAADEVRPAAGILLAAVPAAVVRRRSAALGRHGSRQPA